MTGEDAAGGGPVPVRDLLGVTSPVPVDEATAEPAASAADAAASADAVGADRSFDMDGGDWVARIAGSGCYGTGGRGGARLLAVHFYNEAEPDRPVREALLPADHFDGLMDTELRELFQRATPIALDRDRR